MKESDVIHLIREGKFSTLEQYLSKKQLVQVSPLFHRLIGYHLQIRSNNYEGIEKKLLSLFIEYPFTSETQWLEIYAYYLLTCVQFYSGNILESIESAEKALQLIKKAKFIDKDVTAFLAFLQGMIIAKLALSSFLKGNSSSVLPLLTDEISRHDPKHDQYVLSYLYNSLGVYYALFDFKNAESYFLRAKHFIKQTEDKKALLGVLSNISKIHRVRGKFKGAMSDLLELHELLRTTKKIDPREMFFLNLSIADLYTDLGDTPKAKLYLSLAQELSEELSLVELSYAHHLHALIAFLEGDFTTSELLAQKALQFQLKGKNYSLAIDSIMFLAFLYHWTRELPKLLNLYETYFPLLQEYSTNPYVQVNALLFSLIVELMTNVDITPKIINDALELRDLAITIDLPIRLKVLTQYILYKFYMTTLLFDLELAASFNACYEILLIIGFFLDKGIHSLSRGFLLYGLLIDSAFEYIFGEESRADELARKADELIQRTGLFAFKEELKYLSNLKTLQKTFISPNKPSFIEALFKKMNAENSIDEVFRQLVSIPSAMRLLGINITTKYGVNLLSHLFLCDFMGIPNPKESSCLEDHTLLGSLFAGIETLKSLRFVEPQSSLVQLGNYSVYMESFTDLDVWVIVQGKVSSPLRNLIHQLIVEFFADENVKHILQQSNDKQVLLDTDRNYLHQYLQTLFVKYEMRILSLKKK